MQIGKPILYVIFGIENVLGVPGNDETISGWHAKEKNPALFLSKRKHYNHFLVFLTCI